MKLVTYRLSGAEHVGALTADGKGVLPLPAADMNTLIETMTLADLRSAAAAAERGGAVPLSDVELLAPIPRPRQDVVCLGMNYRDHAEESARYSADAFTKNSTAAVYFSKRVSEAGKPDGVIPRHAGLTDRLDYEAELAADRANRAYKLADSIEMPGYIKSTYIDQTTIRSPVIEGGEFYGEEFNIIAGSDFGSFNLYGPFGSSRYHMLANEYFEGDAPLINIYSPCGGYITIGQRRNGIVYFEGIVDFSAADVQGLDLGTGA